MLNFSRIEMNQLSKFPQIARIRARSKMSGYLMIELALFLAVTSILTLMQVTKIHETLENALAEGTGQYMVQVQSAVNRYQSEFDTQLKNSDPITGFANPLQPTLAELIASKHLPAGFGPVSPLGLAFVNVLSLDGCPGVSCAVNGVTYSTTGYRDVGNILRSDLLGIAVAKIGVDGGQSMNDTPAQITGYAGSFSIPNPTGSIVGVLAIRTGVNSGLNSLLSQFYKLDGSRRLTGTMDANNNDMRNIKDLLSTGVLTMNEGVVNGSILLNGSSAAGSACVAGETGKIRKSTTGDGLVICNASIWEQVGSAVSGISVGGACSTTNLLGTSATGVAYICNGSFWTTLSKFANAGDACAPAGKTATSASTNEELVCRNGQFVRISSLLPKNVQVGAHFAVRDGDVIAKPVCDTSGVPNYSLALSQSGVDVSIAPPYQATYVAAVNNGASWTILLRLKRSPADGGGEVSGTPYGLSAVMTLECTY